MDQISEFIEFIVGNGYAPFSTADIKADGKWHDYRLLTDKPGSRNGNYVLTIEGGHARGQVADWREQNWVSWSSKSVKKLDPSERKAWRDKLAADIKAAEAERGEAQAVVAKEAARRWRSAKPVDAHAYLTRKGVAAHGTKVEGETLLLRIIADGKTVNLQTISPAGLKMFMKGGRKQGGYYPLIEDGEDKSVLILCEGFSTGATIREATGKPVIVCFDAGNLKPVAAIMRGKYPTVRVIIAADNDQWVFENRKIPEGVEPEKMPGNDPRWASWRDDGLLYNPGVSKAQQAAAAIGGAAVVWPDIPKDDKAKRTDFNDYGIDATRERFLPVLADRAEGVDGSEGQTMLSLVEFGSQTVDPAFNADNPPDWFDDIPSKDDRAEIEIYNNVELRRNPGWRNMLVLARNGEPEKRSVANALMCLCNHEVYSKIFRYDEFAKELVVAQPPPWIDADRFHVHTVNDDDVQNLAAHMERHDRLIQPADKLLKILYTAAKNNSVNPAQEYFKRLKWDGVKRIDNWLSYYAGAEFGNERYVAMVSRKWLVAAVTRVFHPGAKFDHVLILEGDQGAGKSRMLAELATIGRKRYFDDTIKVTQLGDDKIVPKLQGVLIVELQELSGFSRKAEDELKAAVTICEDRIIPKYSNNTVTYGRQFVFAATVNPQGGYFKDATGNRRFWPVKVGKKIDVEALREDKDQLWAEAYAAYDAGEYIYIDDDEMRDLAIAEQRERDDLDPWHEKLDAEAGQFKRITYTEIYRLLEIREAWQQTAQTQKRISNIMTRLGYTYQRRRIEGKHPYVWEKLK